MFSNNIQIFCVMTIDDNGNPVYFLKHPINKGMIYTSSNNIEELLKNLFELIFLIIESKIHMRTGIYYSISKKFLIKNYIREPKIFLN